jgi:hypothetical protein
MHRLELVRKIKRFERTLSHSLRFKHSLIVTIIVTTAANFIASSLYVVSTSLLYIYDILVGIMHISQVVILYVLAHSFHKILHRNDKNPTFRSVTNAGISYDEYLKSVIRRLVVLGTLLLINFGTILLFLLFVKHAYGFVIFEIIFRTTEFSMFILVLNIIFLKKGKGGSSSTTSEQITGEQKDSKKEASKESKESKIIVEVKQETNDEAIVIDETPYDKSIHFGD